MKKASRKVGLQRLEKLATFLEKLPAKKFKFSEWVADNWKGRQDLKCGTQACALGWAATIPEFRKAGIFLAHAVNETGNPTPGGYVTFKGADREGTYYNSLEAASRLFGLSEDEAEGLFVPEHGNDLYDTATPKQVAANIRRFVANAEAALSAR